MIIMLEEVAWKRGYSDTEHNNMLVECLNYKPTQREAFPECAKCEKTKWLWCDKCRRERNYGKLYHASK